MIYRGFSKMIEISSGEMVVGKVESVIEWMEEIKKNRDYTEFIPLPLTEEEREWADEENEKLL